MALFAELAANGTGHNTGCQARHQTHIRTGEYCLFLVLECLTSQFAETSNSDRVNGMAIDSGLVVFSKMEFWIAVMRCVWCVLGHIGRPNGERRRSPLYRWCSLVRQQQLAERKARSLD